MEMNEDLSRKKDDFAIGRRKATFSRQNLRYFVLLWYTVNFSIFNGKQPISRYHNDRD